MTFSHPPATLAFWTKLVRRALAAKTSTPFYLFSAEPVRAALAELDTVAAVCDRRWKIRHWLSCKTQPVAPLLRWWRAQGRPIEVVSEFEFLAAHAAGFPVHDILLNGPAKHRWLPRHAAPEMRVNFDSIKELRALLPLAKKLRWRTGLRLHTSEEKDYHGPGTTQFGFTQDEGRRAVNDLARAGLHVETLHFHLRTNVESAEVYARALGDVILFCQLTGVCPRFLDCGGGFPPPHTLAPDGRAFDRDFDLRAMGEVFRRQLAALPGVEELWLENGRFLLARSGVLVTRILDVKERAGIRQLICDGGRTMNALVTNWEEHAIFPMPSRRGARRPTMVYGPTCMSFDQAGLRPLPGNLGVGDHLVWMEAGAYHVPWETRFSHGLAAAFWHEGGKLTVAREPESFEHWWGQWR